MTVNNLQTTECSPMSFVSWGHVKKSQGFRLQVYSTLNSKLKTEKDFPHSSVDKELTCNAGDLGLIPGSGRSPGEANGNPLQYPCLENPMDRGAWRATVHGVAKSRT